MKKNVVLGLLLGSCLVSASCVSQYPLNNNGIDKTEVKIVRNQGIVEIKVNKNTFPKKSFSTKAVDFSSTEIKKLKFNILPLGTGTCATELTTSVDWTAGTPINISLTNVPLGKALLSLHALDVDGKILSSLHGMLEVVAGNNSAKISIFESAVAQVFMQWLSCTDESKALWQKVSIADVRNLIKAETGYDETTNKFTKINPTSLDITKIASNIQQNNGSVPVAGTISNIEGSSSVNVNISEIGASVTINDLTSTPVATTTSNAVSIPNVSFGKWLITVRKAGFQTYQAEFTADGIVNLSNVQLVPLVTPTPTPSPTITPVPIPTETPLPTPTPTPTSTPVPTPTPSAVLTEVTIPTVHDEKMLIDGYEDDWTGITPAMTDATGNGYPDLTALYLAMDSEYLYYKFDAVEKVSISGGGAWDAGFSLRLKENSSINSEGDISFRAFNLTNESIDENNMKYSIAYPAIKFEKIINGVSTPLIPTQPYISNSIYRHSYFISKKGVCEGKILLSELGNINNKEVSWGYFTGSNNPKKFKIVNFAIPTFNPFITNAILFTKEIVGGSGTNLYIVSEDGTKERELIKGPVYNATWSSDGSKIAYDAGGRIFIQNKDGSSRKELISSDTFYDASYPVWSPDGSKIVFSGKKTNISNGQIFTMNSDGTNIVQISNFVPIEPDKVETTCTKPSWSPDGSKISYLVQILSGSFSGQDAYNSTGSYIVNADGTNVQKSPYASGAYFRWSPDGSKIAYVRDNFGLYSIFIEDLNTKDVKSIEVPNNLSNTGSISGDFSISWSKDSKKIVFQSISRDLFVVDVGNLTVKNITNTKDIGERAPSWRPY
jgi:Tol biopolymer transport system component